MATSSEDVLQMVPYVRHKKVDGSLYVMDSRIAWMPDGKDTFTISHHYSEIKMQKVSPADKARIQLQVVLQDGNATTFLFSNPEGSEFQLKDREKVKDLLVQLLPKFKRKISKELEEKNKLLTDNPMLLQLYKQLVIPETISADEFWTEYAPPLIKSSVMDITPRVGVSKGFLAEIKPQVDGVNELRVNLTKDMIEDIYKTYPSVKRKHDQYVPKKMTEEDFWAKFIQSHYVQRDRVNLGDDLFSECAKIDDQEYAKEIGTGVSDPLVDLTRFKEQDFVTEDEPMQIESHHLHPLIRRINQHSINIMKACARIDESGLTNGSADAVNGSNVPEPASLLSKEDRLRESVRLEDLEGGPPQEEVLINKSKLKMSGVDHYLHGPTVDTQSGKLQVSDPKSAISYLNQALVDWCTDDRGGKGMNPINSTSAVTVVQELSVGGKLMSGSDMDALAAAIPEERLVELRGLYQGCSELLRHFWSSFPATTPAGEEKIIHKFESLINFQQKQLIPFEQKLQREVANGSHVTRHLQTMLLAANSKYQKWQVSRRPTGPPR